MCKNVHLHLCPIITETDALVMNMDLLYYYNKQNLKKKHYNVYVFDF